MKRDVSAFTRVFSGLFDNILWFSEHTFRIAFVRFTPEYFIFCDAAISGIVFLASFSYCSSLVPKNTRDSVTWSRILQPRRTHLLALIFFRWIPPNFLCTGSRQLQTDSFPSSFPIRKPFTSFCRLITLRTLLNMSSERGRFCCAPDPGGVEMGLGEGPVSPTERDVRRVLCQVGDFPFCSWC